ncbi:anti-sigma factor [Rhodopseudomonas sp.]|uniref:anti-sigma factor n=1 Tax=Rhodopseudomonas sp. TaxID=1078 RepID=UPI003B3ACAB2
MSARDDDDALAAEFVMGLLEGAEREAAERRLATDDRFAAAVEAWRQRLAAFDVSAEEMPPSPALWQRIVATTQQTSPDLLRAESEGGGARLWDNIRFWRFAGLGAAVAATMAGVLVIDAMITTRQLRTELATLAERKPVYVAVLVNDQTQQAGAIVNAFANGRVDLIPLRAIDVPPGRTLQVWTLWDRAIGPKSIGLTDQPRALQLDLNSLPETVPDQLFEITLEPAGGSPIGRPTGPILFKGNAARAL